MFIFNPPLASALPVLRSPLVFTLRDGDDVQSLGPDATVQVWTDFPEHSWHSVDFVSLPHDHAAQLSLAASPSHTAEAHIVFDELGDASSSSSSSYNFTYRIVDRRDGSVLRWLGDPHSNGTLRRDHNPLFVSESAGWEDDEDDIRGVHTARLRAWNGPLPSDVALFGIPNPLRSHTHAAHLHVPAFAITAHSAVLRFRLVPEKPHYLLLDNDGHGAPDEPWNLHLVALALFPPHDRPVLFSGDDFRMIPQSDNHAADPLFTLHARSRIFLRRHFDADAIRACVKALPALHTLDTGTQAFLAVLHSASTRAVTILPTSIPAPSRSVLHLTDLGRIVATPSALYSPGSHSTCILHSEHCIDVLTPSDGGVIVVGTTFQSENGVFVSVLHPADATLRPSSPLSSSYSTVDQRTLALRRGLLSLPALCAVAWFLVTTVLRLLPSFAPVRFALAVSERAERLLYERVFGLPRAPGPSASRANGKIIAQNGADKNEVVIDIPTGKPCPLVTLLLRSPADAVPAVFCGSQLARVVTKKPLDLDGSTTLLQVEYPTEKESLPLRIVL